MRKKSALIVLVVYELFFFSIFIDALVAGSKKAVSLGRMDSTFFGRGGVTYSFENYSNSKRYSNTVYFTSIDKNSIVEVKKGLFYYYISVLIPEIIGI